MITHDRFLTLPNASIHEADVLILPVPYEQTVTYKPGTADGPGAILAASEQLEFYDEDMQWCPLEYMRLCVLPRYPVDPHQSAQAFHQGLFDYTRQLPENPLFIALGGEHSITPAMVFARMRDGGTVIQIDAHADLRPSYQGSVYNHACPMFRLRERGYRLIQIGIRSLHANEAAIIATDDGITTYFDRKLQQPGEWMRLLDQLGSLTGAVWLTIDMDGFDPTLIAGVGTPQPGGLSWHRGLDVLQVLFNNQDIDIHGIDVLELVPEPSCVSDMMAAKLVHKCISYWGKAKGLDRQPPNGSQIGANDE